MPDVEIRPCKSDDLPSVLALLQQLEEVAPGGSPLTLAGLQILLQRMDAAPGYYLNLVAVHSEQVAGFISLIFYLTLFHRGGTALINELVVDSAQRGHGIGRALIDQAMASAIARGMDEIEVGTEQSNAAAQTFYARCGFDEAYVLLGKEFD